MSDLFERGLEVRREVLGDDYVTTAMAKAHPVAQKFQRLVSTYCWGELWGSDGLDRRTRSLINVAMIAALGRSAELKLHVGGALTNGCTEDEIAEALLHATIYAGVPVGVEGFKVAAEVFTERSEG